MRGIAILAIMLHNYTHWLKGIVRENEYTWHQLKNDQLWHYLQNPDELLPLHLFSYFGHYGVPVFLFLSGFGLVMKYEQGQLPEIGIWRFVRYNYLKLFRIFIVGFVAFVMLDAITPNMHRYEWTEVVAMLGMFANFFEEPSRVVWPGPYWYFSLTLQLYIVYRLLFYRFRHWGVVVALVVGCWLWQAGCEGDTVMLERLRYNLIGGMLPFGMGILVARFLPASEVWESLSPFFCRGWGRLLLLFISIVLVFVMSFSFQSWLWIPVLIVVGTVALVKLLPSTLLSWCVWLGSISAAIFVAHPLVRKIFVRPYLYDDMYAGLLLYVVATLFLSWLFKKMTDQMPSPKL
jgi:peptidoglycan/LPS O-acetylase OafA/YrhL